MAEPRNHAQIREREIERQLEKLRSENPADREQAALYLGEAAVGEAVDELIEVYIADDEKRVRKAAAYALGQFKAIDNALKKGKQAEVEQLIKRVEIYNKLGRRAAVGPTIQVVVILLVLLGILVAAIILAPRFEDQLQVVQSVTAPRRDRATLIQEAQAYFNSVNTDTQQLTAEYQRILGGDTLTCEARFANPTTYLIAPDDAAANPDVRTVINQLNGLTEQLRTARLPYDEACAGSRTLTSAESGPLLQPLVPITQSLGEVAAQVALWTEAPTQANSTPTTVVTPTFPPGQPLVHVQPLTSLANSLIAVNGPATVLLQYWQEAVTIGSSTGCQQPAPLLPANYELPAADAAASGNLSQAATEINQALDVIRNSWNQFSASCSENALAREADTQVPNLQNAITLIGLALQRLELVSGGVF